MLFNVLFNLFNMGLMILNECQKSESHPHPLSHEVCGCLRGAAHRRGPDPQGAVGVDGAAAEGHRAQVESQGRYAQVLGTQGWYHNVFEFLWFRIEITHGHM